MGTWGTGIFDDDLALDLKDDYRELVADGLSGPEATRLVTARWEPDLADPDVEPVFWLSLAATQWQVGRLEDSVKAKALEIIDSGADLVRWQDDPWTLKRRRQVLVKLRQQLELPPSPPKKIRKTYKSTCEWEVGEIIAYRLGSGRLTLLRILGLNQDKGGVSPIVDFLDCVGEVLPPAATLENLPARRSMIERTDAELTQSGVTEASLATLSALTGTPVTWEDLRRPRPQIILCRTKEQELPAQRLQRLGIKTPSVPQPGISRVILWRGLDAYLEEVFGLT
jgi:hypothetical protein